jgi:hypothetical protein
VESGAGLKLVGVSELFTGGKQGWVQVGWGKGAVYRWKAGLGLWGECGLRNDYLKRR